MNCLQCGIEFIPSKNDVRIKFCCVDCRLSYRNSTKYTSNWSKENRDHIRKYREERREQRNERRRELYKNDESVRKYYIEYSKIYKNKYPERYKNRRLKEKGITLEQYNTILNIQNKKCAICGSTQPDNRYKKYFYVDHNHINGKIRGLLCFSCNLGLGLFKDNIKFLESAIKYLRYSDG